MGATKLKQPIRVSLGHYKRVLREKGFTIVGTPFEGMPDHTLLECRYELPNGGGIVEVVGRLNTDPIRMGP